jgi:hypothetical protein
MSLSSSIKESNKIGKRKREGNSVTTITTRRSKRRMAPAKLRQSEHHEAKTPAKNTKNR